MLKKSIFPCNQEPPAGNAALDCANLPHVLTIKVIKKKHCSHSWSTFSNTAQHLPPLSSATFLYLNQLHHLPCPWILLPHLLLANLPVTTSFFKYQGLDCILVPSGHNHCWPWRTANSPSVMDSPQLPMTTFCDSVMIPTPPGVVCNFLSSYPMPKGKTKARPILIRADM